MSYYAVAQGRTKGIFSTWDNGAKEQVNGYPNAKYKKFKTKHEADSYLESHGVIWKRTTELLVEDIRPLKKARIETRNDTSVSKISHDSMPHYVVLRGRSTGIFSSWSDVEQAIENYPNALVRKFPSKPEAILKWNESKNISLGKDNLLDADQVITPEPRNSIENVISSSTEQVPDPHDPSTLVAFCDGSAIGNGSARCKAAYACVFPHNEDWNIAAKITEKKIATNNQAEYMASLEAMKRANLENPSQDKVLYIFTDSMVLLRSMTEWLPTWQRNNWTKSNGERVKNIDLLQLLVHERGQRKIIWQHVKAHTNKKDWNSIWNAKVDEMARRTALS